MLLTLTAKQSQVGENGLPDFKLATQLQWLRPGWQGIHMQMDGKE